MAGLSGDGPVKCARDTIITPDTSLDAALAAAPYDAIVLPGGGPGAKALASDPRVSLRFL